MFAERRLRVLRIFNPQISEAQFLQHGIVIAQRSSGPWGSMWKCVVPIFRSYRWPIRAYFIYRNSCYYPYFKIGIAVEYNGFKRHYQGRVPVLYNQVDVIWSEALIIFYIHEWLNVSVKSRANLCQCQIRNGWYAGWLISSIGGHPIYFIWHNIAPFCFLIIQIRPNITALHFHYSCITIVYLLPHAYKPNNIHEWLNVSVKSRANLCQCANFNF
jgi:hypothetical protein